MKVLALLSIVFVLTCGFKRINSWEARTQTQLLQDIRDGKSYITINNDSFVYNRPTLSQQSIRPLGSNCRPLGK